jgi:hypothetical protein
MLLVAVSGAVEAFDAEECSSFVERCGHMDVEVRIDLAGDVRARVVTVIPSFGFGWGDTEPGGTTDKTATGPCEAGSYEVTPSDRPVSSG